MPSSTSGCEPTVLRGPSTPPRRPTRLGPGVAFVILLLATAAPARWSTTPDLRIGAGDESDLVLDPGVTREVVEAGSFVEFTPSFEATHRGAPRRRLDLGTSLSWQTYLEGASRRLYGQSAWADLRLGLDERWLLRVSASADAFDDSERSTVRRFGGGGEIGLAWLHRRFGVEVWTGGRGRSYPELDVVTVDGSTEAYGEAAVSGGIDLRLRPAPRVRLATRLLTQTNEARDDAFDARSWAASAALVVDLTADLRASAFGRVQDREFTARTTAEDSDAYRQAGLGLDWATGGFTVELRAAVARYEWPDGAAETSHRWTVALRRSWGSDLPAPILPPGDFPASPSGLRTLDDDGTVRLRVRAPDATRVAVAGDFNAWDPRAHPLRPLDDGWWVVTLRLEPGRYEYAYVVDGRWVVPPEADVTVDDGFGGRNGVLEVIRP